MDGTRRGRGRAARDGAEGFGSTPAGRSGDPAATAGRDDLAPGRGDDEPGTLAVPRDVEWPTLRAVDAADATLEAIAEDLGRPVGEVARVLEGLVLGGLVRRWRYRGAFAGCRSLEGLTLHRLTPRGTARLEGGFGTRRATEGFDAVAGVAGPSGDAIGAIVAPGSTASGGGDGGDLGDPTGRPDAPGDRGVVGVVERPSAWSGGKGAAGEGARVALAAVAERESSADEVATATGRAVAGVEAALELMVARGSARRRLHTGPHGGGVVVGTWLYAPTAGGLAALGVVATGARTPELPFPDQVLAAVGALGTASCAAIAEAMGLDQVTEARNARSKVNATLAKLQLAGRVTRREVESGTGRGRATTYGYALATTTADEAGHPPEVFPEVVAAQAVAAPDAERRSPGRAREPGMASPTLASPKVASLAAVSLAPTTATPMVGVAPPRTDDARARGFEEAGRNEGRRRDVAGEARGPAATAVPERAWTGGRPPFKEPALSARERMEREIDPFAHLRAARGAALATRAGPRVTGGARDGDARAEVDDGAVLRALRGIGGSDARGVAAAMAAAGRATTSTEVATALERLHEGGLVWARREPGDGVGPGVLAYRVKD